MARLRRCAGDDAALQRETAVAIQFHFLFKKGANGNTLIQMGQGVAEIIVTDFDKLFVAMIR
jgi:hypothetical protein